MKKILASSLGIFFTIMLVTQCQQPRPNAEVSSDPGAQLFLHYCARCHQDNGIGGPAPGGLNAPDMRQFTKSERELETIINYGFGKMPSFKDSTTADNISAIAKYVATQIEFHSNPSDSSIYTPVSSDSAAQVAK